jgi:hypothetical protein
MDRLAGDSGRESTGRAARTWEDHRVQWSVQDPGTSDYEYRRRIRRYRPSSLLPLIAAAAARYWEHKQWLNSPYRKFTPWALADAARVCLAYGTEFDRAEASESDLLQILNAYSQFADPVVRHIPHRQSATFTEDA